MTTEAVERAREALIDALVRLFKTRAIGQISVRDIGKEAGVNHGLVHRHFGSKEGLVTAAVERLSSEIHRGDPETRTLSSWSFGFLRQHPELAQVVARACLDGPSTLLPHAAPTPERLEAIVAPIKRFLEQIGAGEKLDAYVINALATSAFLGWVVFQPLLERGFGLPEDADEQIEGLLEQLDAALAPFMR